MEKFYIHILCKQVQGCTVLVGRSSLPEIEGFSHISPTFLSKLQTEKKQVECHSVYTHSCVGNCNIAWPNLQVPDFTAVTPFQCSIFLHIIQALFFPQWSNILEWFILDSHSGVAELQWVLTPSCGRSDLNVQAGEQGDPDLPLEKLQEWGDKSLCPACLFLDPEQNCLS